MIVHPDTGAAEVTWSSKMRQIQKNAKKSNGVKYRSLFLKNAALSVRPDTGAERKETWKFCPKETVQMLFIARMTSKKTTQTAPQGTGARRNEM